jgi:hypothetical protein
VKREPLSSAKKVEYMDYAAKTAITMCSDTSKTLTSEPNFGNPSAFDLGNSSIRDLTENQKDRNQDTEMSNESDT